MSVKNFILATAGHVDHGKSALVKALTGTDPDRLPEEKARGITIDLGFAHLELYPPASCPSASRLHLAIVDVPGHEDFVKNMIAGVGSLDIALLIVAADDGWMPQTEEHTQILACMGITRAVVALTKADLLTTNGDAILADIRAKLRGTPFAEAPLVKTSAVTGQGLDELKTTLAGLLTDAPTQPDIGKPRLLVDRAFAIKGAGTVVTGVLTGGVLHREQTVVVQPGGATARIRAIQSHHQDAASIGPGTRTALNLPELTIKRKGRVEPGDSIVQRGDTITLPELGRASHTLDAWIERSARPLEGRANMARPLESGAMVRVHHGCGNFSARITLLDAAELAPGTRSLARLRAGHPVFVFIGDRFIVRDWSGQVTLAGGVVLNMDVGHDRPPAKPDPEWLRQRAESPEQVAVFVKSELARAGAARRSALLVQSRFSAAAISECLAQLTTQGAAISKGDWLSDAAWWKILRQRAVDAIDAEHRAHPEHAGLSLSDLRAKLEDVPHLAEMFDALLSDLCKEAFIQAGAAIRRITHRPTLPPRLQGAGAKLRAALSAKPFEPPSRRELTPDTLAQQALRFLVETREAVEISDEIVLPAENLDRAKNIIRQYLRAHGSATVSELRQAVGSSRRILVPLLEYLDRAGITLRQGDRRVLRSAPSGNETSPRDASLNADCGCRNASAKTSAA
ncbi:MAG: selenocysteine-specific translation elongation factor [Verrucomicrobia bacterium]|nr:selenocysteine-specific translation elongation factor [Verrucomicrobiota bacterium]